MKRLSIFSLIGCLSLFLSLPFVAAAETITLSFSDQNSDMSWGPVHATQPWVKQVEKATNGRVKIQIYPNQTLAKGSQNWRAVKDGIADMAWFILGYAPGLAPYAEVIQLPGLPFDTAEQGSEIIWKLYERFPEIREEFADNKVLLFHTSPVMKLLMAKSPVRTLEDLKGLKIRSHGGPVVETFKKWGASPVLVPMPECYMAMQKGTIDGMTADWEPIPGFRLHEVVRHITDNVPLNAAFCTVIMNKKKWESLPKDIQDAIVSVGGLEGSKFFGRNFFDSAKEPVKKMIKDQGYDISVYTLPAKQRERWVEAGPRPTWEEWVQRMERKGAKKAREILNAALEIAK